MDGVCEEPHCGLRSSRSSSLSLKSVNIMLDLPRNQRILVLRTGYKTRNNLITTQGSNMLPSLVLVQKSTAVFVPITANVQKRNERTNRGRMKKRCRVATFRYFSL